MIRRQTIIKWMEKFSPTQFILLGFAVVILMGSLILSLPICSADGRFTPYIDALFTATTSVCVTGLTTVSTAFHWSIFGKIVILLLIQFGGMGFVAVLVLFMVILRRHIGIKNRLLIQQSYGLDSIHGVVTFLHHVIKGMLFVEAIGAVCYMPVLVAEFGLVGIAKSIFLSISAFCNAGMDLMGDTSLANYVSNYWMNFVTISLIVLGGIGFVVWWEFTDFIKKCIKKEESPSNIIKKMSLHTKIVLQTTAILLAVGTLAVLFFEYHNPETLGGLSFCDKLVAAFFQSVTTRTAGFYTISQAALSDASSLVCMILMFIGGSPSGTAGGVKTMTVAIIAYAIYAEASGKEDITAFHRTISSDNVRKVLTIICYSIGIWLVMTVLFCSVEKIDFVKACYETVSAIATVGLSKDVTGTLHIQGKLVIIFMMYAGRIGPVTLATAFLTKGKNKDMIHYADENVLLG